MEPAPDNTAVDVEGIYKFERGVLCHVVGTLLAWGLAIVAYLMFQLWKDYISTIINTVVLFIEYFGEGLQYVFDLPFRIR